MSESARPLDLSVHKKKGTKHRHKRIQLRRYRRVDPNKKFRGCKDLKTQPTGSTTRLQSPTLPDILICPMCRTNVVGLHKFAAHMSVHILKAKQCAESTSSGKRFDEVTFSMEQLRNADLAAAVSNADYYRSVNKATLIEGQQFSGPKSTLLPCSKAGTGIFQETAKRTFCLQIRDLEESLDDFYTEDKCVTDHYICPIHNGKEAFPNMRVTCEMHPSLTTIADALLANSSCSKENRDHIDRLSNPQQTSMQHALFTCHQMNVKLPLKQLDEKRHELRTHFVQRRPQCANDVTAYNLLLRSHPVHSLLPSELASSMDSTEAAKRCHFCLKEFTDEMAVLRHQVQSHKLLESPSNSILQPLDIVLELSATRHCSKPAYI